MVKNMQPSAAGSDGDKAAFEAWASERLWPSTSTPGMPLPLRHSLMWIMARNAFAAGAAHGREEAERAVQDLRDEAQSVEMHARINRAVAEALGQEFGETWHDLGEKVAALRRTNSEQAGVIRSFQDGYHQIAAALGTTVPATSDEDIVDRIEKQAARVKDLEERLRASLLEQRAAWAANLARIESPTPAPHAELRDAVVEAAMAWMDTKFGREGMWRKTTGEALWDACAALDRAATAESEPVREAAERLRALLDRHSPSTIALYDPNQNDLRTVLDALDAKGEHP